MLLVNYSTRLLIVSLVLGIVYSDDSLSFDTQSGQTNELFTIIGRISTPKSEVDFSSVRILVDDGHLIGHLKEDGSFSISNVPSGSYIIEVTSPKSYFEPIRIDINSKGKIRSRKLNLIQPNDVKMLEYPLKFESRGMPNYFQKREQFRILDILLSPMVLMMVVPLLLILVLPKLVQPDPELQRELEQTTSFMQPQGELPSISEFMQKTFGGSSTTQPQKRSTQQQQQRQPPATYSAIPKSSRSSTNNNK